MSSNILSGAPYQTYSELQFLVRNLDKDVLLTHPNEYKFTSLLSELAGTGKADENGIEGSNYEYISNNYYDQATFKNTIANGQIISRTTSGNNLILTLAGTGTPTAGFLVGGTVISDRVKAVIESVTNNTILISPWTDASGTNINTFVSGQFAQGNPVTYFASNLPTGIATFNDAIYYTPENGWRNYIQKFESTARISRDDIFQKKYVEYEGGVIDFFVEDAVRQEYMLEKDNAFRIGTGGIKNGKQQTIGFEYQVKLFGGAQNVYPLTRVPILEDFKNALKQLRKASQVGSANLKFIGSVDMVGAFQDAMQPFVLTAGINNVVGGSKVVGSNVHMYSYDGMTITAEIDDAFNNSVERFADVPSTIIRGANKMDYTGYFINTDKVKYLGKMRPAIERIVQGNPGDEMIYSHYNGIINMRGERQLAPQQKIDGAESSFYSTEAIRVNKPNNHLIMELSA